MEEGSVVILHLMNPPEKYWGLLRTMNTAGVTLRGLNISSFEDWMHAVASEQDPDLGPATVFFPMLRVERMFLDEQVGSVESMSQRFEHRVGRPVGDFLSLPRDSADHAPR